MSIFCTHARYIDLGLARVRLTWLLVATTLFPRATLAADDANEPGAPSVKQLQALDLHDAREFAIYRDSRRTEKLELRAEPVYTWTNPIYRQNGSVFVWTWHGRPEVLGSIFSRPLADKGRRLVVHEFHSLSTAVLYPQRDSENQWKPAAALKRMPIPGAANPADSARSRQLQMRELVRGFAAHSTKRNQRWELRLLPKPLLRYQSTDPEVSDGALYAFVTSAGTDPEILLLIEAVKTADGSSFQCALGRFSDQDLYVNYHGREIWSSVRDGNHTDEDDALELYRSYRDRQIDEIAPTNQRASDAAR